MKDLKIESKYYNKNNDYIVCKLCPHSCNILEGQTGFCRVRKNIGGKLFANSYGRISSLAIDAIEKKPLMHFMPESNILSIGSYGCNFRCDFCQNHDISMSLPETQFLSPHDLTKIALKYKESNNIGVINSI